MHIIAAAIQTYIKVWIFEKKRNVYVPAKKSA